jgi:uncharacterized protein YecT (DUF1311 family)
VTGTFRWFLILASLASCERASAAPDGASPSAAKQTTTSPGTPPGLLGTWDVEQVAVDGQDQIHWDYRPNDPQYLYRALFIAGNNIRFNGSNFHCTQERWVSHSVTWAKLLAKGFPRPPVGGRKVTPTVDDFDLKVSAAASVVAFPICEGKTGKAAFPTGMWVAVMASDKIALKIDSSGFFILSRRAAGAQPRASFACAKATSPTEKTICGDYDLAAWDRSVAAAWRKVIERKPGDDELLIGQKDWLKKRDGCGADATCIQRQMFGRVERLVQEAIW